MTKHSMADFAFHPLSDLEIQVINERGGLLGCMVEDIIRQARFRINHSARPTPGTHNIEVPASHATTPIVINISQPSRQPGPFTLEFKLVSSVIATPNSCVPAAINGNSDTARGEVGISAPEHANDHDLAASPRSGSVTESDSEAEPFVGEPAPRYPEGSTHPSLKRSQHPTEADRESYTKIRRRNS